MKQAWRALQEKSGGELCRRVLFYSDRLEVNPGEVIEKYEDIVKVLETEHMLILITREKAGIMVLRDVFTNGGPEVIHELIDERRNKND